MPHLMEKFIKTKEFLICIDSDGCAMNTMDNKHNTCFGPSLIPVWELQAWKDQILKRWNDINLYTMTRGINRFKGLAMILREINDHCKPIPGVMEFAKWAEEAEELSAASVKAQWEKTRLPVFRQALEWSDLVNSRITEMPETEKRAFSWVPEAVRKASEFADIAIVSSANRQAVLDEWENQHMLELVDVVASQDNGTKADCIHTLLKRGYEKNHVLMVGDAPGDYASAKENEILFYPILVKREAESWKEFLDHGLDHFRDGIFEGEYQDKMAAGFEQNLQS